VIAAERSRLAHCKLHSLPTEEQHPSWAWPKRFLMVLRARGRVAGGTASCRPGLGDLGLGWMECRSLANPAWWVHSDTMSQRIFRGFVSIFNLVVKVKIRLYRLWLFSQIGGALDKILRGDHPCVLSDQAMKENARCMDSALSLDLGVRA